jgi:hypothetical protein
MPTAIQPNDVQVVGPTLQAAQQVIKVNSTPQGPISKNHQIVICVALSSDPVVVLTLPANPDAGENHLIVAAESDVTVQGSIDPVTLLPAPIAGINAPISIPQDTSLMLTWSNTDQGWIPLADINVGPDVISSGLYNCPMDVLINQLVYVYADDAVKQANASAAAGGPGTPTPNAAIGFVRSKPSTTTCIVQYYGELGGFVGLVAGATYWLNIVDGGITTTPPSVPPQTVQRVGVARNATTMVVMCDREYEVL